MRLITPKHKKFWSPSLIIPSGGLGFVAGLTFQAFATEGAVTATPSFAGVNFGTANANRVIAVIAVGRANAATNQTISSMTIGGIAATQVASAAGVVSNVAGIDIWYASVPTGASGTVAVTWSSANVRSGIYVYSIITTTPAPSVGSGTSGVGTTTLSRTITIPASGFGIAGAWHRQTGNTDAMVNASIDGDNTLFGTNHQFFCGHTTGTGSTTITANSTPTGNDMCMTAAAWSP